MRFAYAVLLLLALGGCQCTTSTCGPGTCYGCCDSTGFCRDGMQNVQCGTSGAKCEVCKPGDSCVGGACTQTRVVSDGGRCAQTECMRGTTCDQSDGVCRCNGVTCGAEEFCDAGQCQRGPPDGGLIMCNFMTCRGCCQSADTCHPGNTASACGFNGAACQPCQPPGFCPNGFCNGPPPDAGFCGPGSCPGCCQGNFCQTGSSQFACGSFGQQCQSCGNGSCGFDAGFFQCRAACDFRTCPTGCCSNGTCMPVISDTFCGRFGELCSNCLPGRCGDAGFCIAPCAQSCSGCCIGETCVPTPLQDGGSCGMFGEACRSCGAAASCQSGACTNPDGGSCSQLSCPGCCEGAECRQAPIDTACGLNGRGCVACDAGASCQFGACNRVPGDGGFCGPSTCFGGCCSGGACGTGNNGAFCGNGGAACVSCDQLGGQTCDFDRVCRGIGVGAACGDGGCSGMLFCRRGEYPGGYCTMGCSGTCPTGDACSPYDGGFECRRRCGISGPCRPGYQCAGGDAGVCEPL